MKSKFSFNQKSKVLEIASNDGSLLKEVKKKYKSMVLGIDPAKNLKAISTKNGVPTIVEFFSNKFSKKIKKKYKTFDFCIARNVIAHTPDPNDIFKGVKNILKEEEFNNKVNKLREKYKSYQDLKNTKNNDLKKLRDKINVLKRKKR